MIGNKVDNDLQSCLVSAGDEGFKFLHALLHIHGEVWIHVIVVTDGVWRACLSLYYCRMLRRYSILGIVCLRGMTYHSRVPDMGDTHLFYRLQFLCIKVSKLSCTIFGNRTPLFPSGVTIAEKSGKYLIYNYLLGHK